jgi:hypothetical protein
LKEDKEEELALSKKMKMKMKRRKLQTKDVVKVQIALDDPLKKHFG